MSDSPRDNDDLLNFIASTVEAMRDQMATMQGQMVKKEDLERFATREDVGSLRNEVSYLGGRVETMGEQMATKNDIARLEAKMDAGFTAVRGDIEQTHLRLDSVERVFASRVDRIEVELSRMRSVLYLLVKDKPDMLRLLGQAPPAGGEGRP